MLPDALPQLIDTLLRLPLLDAAQLRELIEHLPDPQASAQEMVQRGWITQEQFSSLFPGTQQRTRAPQETLLIGLGEDEVPPDLDSDNWDLPISDEEDKGDVSREIEWPRLDLANEEMLPEAETVGAVPVLSGAASNPQFEWDMLVPPVAGEARRRESDTEKRLNQWMDWASKGLLIWILFLGSFFAGRQLLGARSTVPPAARQQARKAEKKTRVPKYRREAASPRMAAAKVDKVPNNRVAAVDPGRAVDWPVVQPAAPMPPDPPILPAQAAPQPLPTPAAPVVWNGPNMYPTQAPPQQFPAAAPRVWNGPYMYPTQADPQQLYAFQQWVLQQQLLVRQQIMQGQQQFMQSRQQFMRRHQLRMRRGWR